MGEAMGRPRKDSDIAATAKIEKALWELLETEKYSNITIQKIADRAGVNRNAIYYHYDNVDDVAKQALLNYMHSDVVEVFVHLIMRDFTQKKCINADFLQGIKKLQICINSGSIYLNELLKAEIKKNWFHLLNIDERKLSATETACIEFAMGGIISVLGSKEVMGNPMLLMELIETDIVKVSFASLQKVAKDMADLYWVKVTFFSNSIRKKPPCFNLETGIRYSPHFVVKGDSEYLGVSFEDGDICTFEKEIDAIVVPLYEGVGYHKLAKEVEFFIMEGPHIVGEGIVKDVCKGGPYAYDV